VSGNIPPLGWCATCLIAFDRKRAAELLWKGNSLCGEHLHAVLEDDITQAIKGTDMGEDEDGAG